MGAEVGLGLVYIDNNGAHHLINHEVALADDGSAGREDVGSVIRKLNNIAPVSEADLTEGDGVYSVLLSPHLGQAGTYRLTVRLSNKGNQTFIASPRPSPGLETCCGSVMRSRLERLTGIS